MNEQRQWTEHAHFMNALAERGFVILGGPVGDGARVLLIIDAENERDVEAGLADDPWTAIGLLDIESIEPWKILLRSLSTIAKAKRFRSING